MPKSGLNSTKSTRPNPCLSMKLRYKLRGWGLDWGLGWGLPGWGLGWALGWALGWGLAWGLPGLGIALLATFARACV